MEGSTMLFFSVIFVIISPCISSSGNIREFISTLQQKLNGIDGHFSRRNIGIFLRKEEGGGSFLRRWAAQSPFICMQLNWTWSIQIYLIRITQKSYDLSKNISLDLNSYIPPTHFHCRLSAEGPKIDIRSTHARTNFQTYNALS